MYNYSLFTINKIFLCRYSDSNRDALALLPKSNVSTNFTIAALKHLIKKCMIKQYSKFH